MLGSMTHVTLLLCAALLAQAGAGPSEATTRKTPGKTSLLVMPMQARKQKPQKNKDSQRLKKRARIP